MKKFDRIRVLAPLNLVLYIGALWLTWFFPGWGNLMLVAMDLATLVVLYLVARRSVDVHKVTSWEQLGPKLVIPFLVLIALAILHLIGSTLHDDMLQYGFAYIPVTLVVAGGGVYLLDRVKSLYWRS